MSEQMSFIPRQEELLSVLAHISGGQSVSLVGVSNMGKSDLLRDLCRPDVRSFLRPDLAGQLYPFYIDCNRMLAQTEHAFYEIVLRVIITELTPSDPALADELRREYETLINPPSAFHIPLSFSRALTILIEKHQPLTVLVFDELDTAYSELDARVFLNMRALKDRYGNELAYVVATDRRLSHLRTGEDVDEFRELFESFVHYVQPLSLTDAREIIRERSEALGATFDENDIAFLYEQAGGHPSLTDISARRLAEITGSVTRSDSEDWLIHRQVKDALRDDLSVSAECDKIWRDLSGNERRTLKSIFLPGVERDAQAARELLRKGLLMERDDDIQYFSALFRDYVRRQGATQVGANAGVRVDAESGEVSVDGRTIETLTKLEFRLLLLLYGRLNKICDKYTIVEAVWGEDYVDEVYDSSIEKLVSRLRRKIELDPASPRYLITVRGRGYKLVG
ncbi:MAG TPA: hypothetical protein G4N94_12740 [Caldilineae bacterium]|nr:hypothetical protein [Caldilineae bacterium]